MATPSKFSKNFEPLHIKGDCNVDDLSEDECNRLVSVGGSLDAVEFVSLSLPNLQSVGGCLWAKQSINLSLPALQSVGRSLDADQSVNLTLPKLQSAGRLDVGETVNLSLPALQSVDGYLYANFTQDLSLPALQSVGGILDADQSVNLTLSFDLAIEKQVPVECLSKETLQQGASAKEFKNQRNQSKGIK